jgi:hypothetical protein
VVALQKNKKIGRGGRDPKQVKNHWYTITMAPTMVVRIRRFRHSQVQSRSMRPKQRRALILIFFFIRLFYRIKSSSTVNMTYGYGERNAELINQNDG